MNESHPIEHPLEDWQRQARYVHQLLRAHPLLQPLRDAGEPICLGCHVRAIWAQAVFLGRGQYQFVIRIEEPEWWVPTKNGRGRILAERLATGPARPGRRDNAPDPSAADQAT